MAWNFWQGDGVNPFLVPPGRCKRWRHRWEAADNLLVVILIRGVVISTQRRGGCDKPDSLPRVWEKDVVGHYRWRVVAPTVYQVSSGFSYCRVPFVRPYERDSAGGLGVPSRDFVYD